ncbi:hypothetical protein [Chitinophaga pinensis]|uniref:Uncharacterized protein n=1 Tax=Chitinophaga pinensis TaxID=79329 RepID=A0A5C6LNX1_9BACT|nr:hypothetical protein [Chitinophaga pinensis]TWV92754.1 hypothetical protein FEF09_28055 [Chitinophaga pinensis]
MSTTLFEKLLENSYTEQQPVSIFLTSAIVHGIVSQLHSGAVEVRTAEGKRCTIKTDKIEAIETL